MKKTIRILSIIAVVLAGLSLLLLLATIPLQRTLGGSIFGYPEELLAILPQFPLLPFLNCFMQTSCMALLVICCGNKKGGIWLEVLTLTLLMLVLPTISRIATPLYTAVLGRFGTMQIAANSLVSNIASFCLVPASLGQALAYVTCGMSIAFKKLSKKGIPEATAQESAG